MKTRTKVLGLMMAAVLLVSATIFGTMAYLTSTDEVTNTFTVGKVDIELDETDVKIDGTKDSDDRVKSNDYHLLPGHEYIKDPTVHVKADSENSYIFVKVENGIADIEAANGTKMKDGSTEYKQIKDQIKENGWTALNPDKDGYATDGVYYKAHTQATAVTNYVVFDNFMIDGSVNGTTLSNYAGKNVKVTAYAIQADGFDTAKAAWDAAGLN
ncbi:MAG: SipW-dependent-type signal peptide-containing protein [Oscillospiraceae bacterium]|nr:SipW-dependent-type signal peptide-containing protein [Oscillospiraceae bacterium]